MRLVRRLALLLALALAIGWLPTASVALGDPPDAESRTIDVSRWLTAPPTGLTRQSRDWVTSAPLPAEDAVLVGADWGGAPDVEVQVRGLVRGDPGDWHPLPLAPADHAADPGTDEARRTDPHTSEPVWLGRVDQLQVRHRGGVPPSVVLHTVALSGGDGIDYLPAELQPGTALAAPDEPTVVPRRSWDPEGQCAPRDAPGYAADVRFAYVHHTAGSNDYSSSQGPSQVLATCLYHRNSREYDDIGYNVLIDRYGNVYEGRAGGLTEPVVGAHAAGFNSGSVGVSLMGNFSSSSPPAAATDALRRFLAWKLDLHHIDPQSSTTEISGGGSTNRYSEDRLVDLDTVIGHRDTGSTACPGDALYAYVDGALRGDVRAEGGPKLFGGPRAEEERPLTGARPVWDVTMSQTGGWRLTIRDDAGRVVRTTSGSGSSADVRWDFRDAAGMEVAAGTYSATFEVTRADATPITTEFDVRPAVERQQGDERIATALQLSRWAFPDEPRLSEHGFPLSEEVVIASAEVYADALVASPLAGSMTAPVLLTTGEELPDSVIEEVRRLGAKEAYLVGGTVRLSDQIERDLRERGGVSTVERFAGPTRYHTAGQVAWEIIEEESPDEVLLALGDHPQADRGFPDALSAGAFGAAFDLPVLLVQPDQLPEPAQWVLSNRPSGGRAVAGEWVESMTIFGGAQAVSASVEAAAARAAGGPAVERLAGGSRYDTSRMAVEELLSRWSEGPVDPNSTSVGLEVVLATGQNWPDALGAGAAAARRGAPLLLVPPRSLEDAEPVRAWLQRNAEALVHGVTAGGPAAVSDEVQAEVEAIIRSDGPNTQPREDWGLGSPVGLPTPSPGPTGAATA